MKMKIIYVMDYSLLVLIVGERQYDSLWIMINLPIIKGKA